MHTSKEKRSLCGGGGGLVPVEWSSYLPSVHVALVMDRLHISVED